MLSNELIIGAVYVLLMVRVMFNHAFTVLVMYRQTFKWFMVHREVMWLLMRNKLIRIVACHRVVHITVSYFCFALCSLKLFGVFDVHAKKVANMTSTKMWVKVKHL